MKKRMLSFKFAFQGLYHLFKGQPNAWIHLATAAGVVVAGFLTGITRTEWLLVAFAIGLVFSAELFNSALEELVDKVSPETHPQAGKIKDLAAAGVLVAAITAAVIGAFIFLPRLIGKW